MRPAIVHPPGNECEAYLIDLHSTVFSPSVQGHDLPPGKLAQIALKAVAIKHLKAGEIATMDGHVYPRPCQLVAMAEFVVRDPLWRGIYPDAARAILGIDHGVETAVSPGGKFKAGINAAGWNQWPFLIAWGWSLWQSKQRAGEDWPLDRRWEEMKAVGYTGGFAAFRQACSRMKLSVTRSGPNL